MSVPLSITILGTGTSQGIPVIGCTCITCTSPDSRDKRLRTAAFIQSGKTGIAMDIGPDFRRQMLDNNLSDVHAVLLTHEHNDHISGLDDIRPVNFRYKRNIPVYGQERSITEMKRRFGYVFDENYAYAAKPRIEPVIIGPEAFSIGDLRITPVPVDHGDMTVYGYRIGDFAYVTDAKRIPPESMQLLQDLDVLILNALRHKAHESHLNFKEAIALSQQLRPRQTYLTHISHEAGRHTAVSAGFPEGIDLAFDGMHITLPQNVSMVTNEQASERS